MYSDLQPCYVETGKLHNANLERKYYFVDNCTMASRMTAGLFLLELNGVSCGTIIEAGEIIFYYSMDQEENKLL